MTECVWGSNTIVEFEPRFGLIAEGDGIDTQSREYQRLSVRIRQGERIDPALLPTRLTLVDARLGVVIPDYIYFNYHIVSERVAGILHEFDLGNGYLHPVEMIDVDGNTPLGTHYIVVAGNAKNVLDVEQSEKTKRTAIGMFETSTVPKDDQLAMTRAALNGPDIWHQPLLKGLYMSDPLVARLKAENIDKFFHLFRVRIV